MVDHIYDIWSIRLYLLTIYKSFVRPHLDYDDNSLIWWLKLSFSSRQIPKCFWKLGQVTGILLKEILRWDDLVIFLEKITSWACLFKSGLNYIFHWWTHSAIFCKSLFYSYASVLASWIMQNSDVSSMNNLTVDMISTDRSLIKIRKKRGPEIDPCGTPALTSNHWCLTI